MDELEPFVFRIQDPPVISTIDFKQKRGVQKKTDMIICRTKTDTT